MAMLPEYARTAASYLGGGIARSMEKQGGKIAEAGVETAQKAGKIGQKVGNFLESVGTQVQQAGATAGMQGGLKKRDIGLAAAGVGLSGSFVGGMGANAGVNALMGYFSQNNMLRQPEQGTYGGSVMPNDLQAGYIPMNTFGSPLALKNLGYGTDIKRAQYNQGLLRAAMGPQFNGMENGQG